MDAVARRSHQLAIDSGGVAPDPIRVVFLGSGEIGIPSFLALLETAWIDVRALITQPDRPAGRALKPRPPAIKALAHSLPVLQPARLRHPESVEQLARLGADLFIVAAYGQILPPTVLELPRLGCINIHASLLPRHRGASPIQASLLAGDKETGITIMWMDEGLDTGDILLQTPCPIGPDESAGSLHDRLARLAPSTLMKALQLIRSGAARRIPQDPALASYAPKISKADGFIRWDSTALINARRARAHDPWPGTFTYLPNGKRLRLFLPSISDASGRPGTILPSPGDRLRIACGEGAIDFQHLQVEGGKKIPAAEFLRGHPLPPGTQFPNTNPPA